MIDKLAERAWVSHFFCVHFFPYFDISLLMPHAPLKRQNEQKTNPTTMKIEFFSCLLSAERRYTRILLLLLFWRHSKKWQHTEGDDEQLLELAYVYLSRQSNSVFNCGFISNFFTLNCLLKFPPGEIIIYIVLKRSLLKYQISILTCRKKINQLACLETHRSWMLMCVMECWVNVCERMRDRHGGGRRLHNEIAFSSNISQDGLLLISLASWQLMQ